MTFRHATSPTLPFVAAFSLGLTAMLPLASRADPLPAPPPPPLVVAPRPLALPQVTLPSAAEPDAALVAGAGPNPFAGRAMLPNAPGQTLAAPTTSTRTRVSMH